jgi:hypothetical protein
MRNRKRLNRYERREMQAQKLHNAMEGTGLYVYENNSDGDLKLPKPTNSGLKMIGPRGRFQGDSYYLKWVGNPMNMLKLIEQIIPQEKIMNEQKLILDQPDTVTNLGKVEHVVAKTPVLQPINDSVNSNGQTPDVLLTEDPVEGLTIIRG